MTDDDKDDQGTQVDQRDDEVLDSLSIVDLQADHNCINHEQSDHDESIQSQDSRWEVIELFESGVIVVD